MALYSTMFGYFNVGVSQVLLTGPDFSDDNRRSALRYTLESLLDCGVIPICNENDVVSVKMTVVDKTGHKSTNDFFAGPDFNDNDGLAALITTTVYMGK
jgi:glutamate 5-kinase